MKSHDFAYWDKLIASLSPAFFCRLVTDENQFIFCKNVKMRPGNMLVNNQVRLQNLRLVNDPGNLLIFQ